LAAAIVAILAALGGLFLFAEEKIDEYMAGMITNPHGIIMPAVVKDMEIPHQFIHPDSSDFSTYDPRIARWCSDAILRVELAAKSYKNFTPPLGTKIYKEFMDTKYSSDSMIFMTFLTTETNPDLLILVIRGTLTKPEWQQDLRLSMVPAKFLGSKGSDYYKDVMIHNGFNTIYSEMRDSLINTARGFSSKPFTLIVTGHSLGAAMTTLAATDMTINLPNVKQTLVHVFGCPRIGNAAFADLVSSRSNLSIHRVVNNSDFFTEVPPSITPNTSNPDAPYPYTHVGDEHSFNVNHFSILANHDLPIYNWWLDKVIDSKMPDEEQHR
jgi:triacylglycerol lipase